MYCVETGGWLSDNQALTIGRVPRYGVPVDLNPSTRTDVICAWSSTGVTITEPNGISHSLPVSVFIGGR